MAPPPPLPINRSSRLRGAAVRPWRAVRRRSASLTGLLAMTITYSCVANGRAVLAELALTGGAYQEAAAKVLRQALLKAEPTTIIQVGSYVYHTLFIDGITYVCATDNGLDTVAPSAFLKKMEYNRNGSSSTLSVVKSRVSDVKSVMLRNMNTVLERETEAVSILTEEADATQATAEEFETTRKIPKRTWWKCFKIVITTLAIPLSIIIILLSTHIIPT